MILTRPVVASVPRSLTNLRRSASLFQVPFLASKCFKVPAGHILFLFKFPPNKNQNRIGSADLRGMNA